MRPLQLSTYSFYLMSATFTLVVPYSYRTLVLFATSSTTICLICSFCASDQIFAEDFLQIPPRDGHPCLLAICFPSLGRIGDFHPLEHAHAGRTMTGAPKDFKLLGLLLFKIKNVTSLQEKTDSWKSFLFLLKQTLQHTPHKP